MKVAIDSSVLVALLDCRDLWRAKALALRTAFLDADVTPVYFDCVAAEAISATVRRLHEKGRALEVATVMDRLHSLASRKTLTWIFPHVPRLYPEVLELMRTS